MKEQYQGTYCILQLPTGAFVYHGTLKGILHSTFRVLKLRDCLGFMLQVPRERNTTRRGKRRSLAVQLWLSVCSFLCFFLLFFACFVETCVIFCIIMFHHWKCTYIICIEYTISIIEYTYATLFPMLWISQCTSWWDNTLPSKGHLSTLIAPMLCKYDRWVESSGFGGSKASRFNFC